MNTNLAEMKKILIIAPFRFGDVLLNTGYLPALRRKFPDSKIDFLTRIPCQMMLENNPNIDELVLFRHKKGITNVWQRAKLFWRVRKEKYDLVIDQTRGTTGGQITFFSGAKYRLGYATSRYKKIYNLLADEGEQRYSGAMRFDLLAPLGIKEEKFNLYFKIKNEDRGYINKWLIDNGLVNKKFVVLSPGSPVKRKMWSLEKYAKLCDLIKDELGCVPILRWIPKEKKYVEKVMKFSKNTILLTPLLDFSGTGALLERAEMLICNDGGVNHFSQAVGCSSLAIFTDSTKVQNWSLQKIFSKHWHITAENGEEVTVEKVFEKLQICMRELKAKKHMKKPFSLNA